MAPQKLKPFDRVLLDAATANLSDDRGQQLIFDYYKRAGYLPAKDIQGRTFKSLQDYLSTVQRLVEKERLKNPSAKPAEWLKSAEARLGLNRQIRTAKTGRDLAIVASKQLEAPKQKLAKNRVGAVFPLEIGSNGEVVFNKRKYMSAEGGIPRPVYDFIASKHGTEVANTYQKTVRKEWKDMLVAAKELETKTGLKVDRGHWLSNKFGGAESARAAAVQAADLNRLQGSSPRGDVELVKETGRVSSGWLDDFYQLNLTNDKLEVLGSNQLKIADLQAISKGVSPDKMIAQRVAEWEKRGRTPDLDPIGFIFGSQIDRDVTLEQQKKIMLQEQQYAATKSGINPRKGNSIPVNYQANLPIPIPTGSQLKQLAPGIKGQLPFAASSAIEPLQRGEPTKALEEVARGTAIGMATDPVVKPIMSRLIPAVGAAVKAAPVAAPAAIAAATELAAPRAAQGGPERVTVNGTPYWLDKKANKVYTNDGRPTNFGIDIKGGKPQLVQRGQGAGTKRAEADPLRQAAQGNLMPVLNMLNPMTQLLRFSNSAMKTIRKEV